VYDISCNDNNDLPSYAIVRNCKSFTFFVSFCSLLKKQMVNPLSQYLAMSNFGIKETQMLFWITSISITLILVALSIWILDYRFVIKLFKKQPSENHSPHGF
jgi:heme/copper-type cytochrome/quinol oxidase subunit 4